MYDSTDIQKVVSFIPFGAFGFYFDIRWGQDPHNSICLNVLHITIVP
jgi:hypothetical protein